MMRKASGIHDTKSAKENENILNERVDQGPKVESVRHAKRIFGVPSLDMQKSQADRVIASDCNLIHTIQMH
jgi:hypothetical protein